MLSNTIIDVHCHLFNAQYAIKELAAVTWNSIWGKYPHRSKAGTGKRAEGTAEKRGIFEAVEGAKDFIAYVARLTRVALGDCGANHSYMCDQFSKSSLGNGQRIISVPLMMDIYYALDNNSSDKARSGKRSSESEFEEEVLLISDKEMDAFKEHLQEIKEKIRQELGDGGRIVQKRGSESFDTLFDEAVEDLFSEKVEKRGSKRTYSGVEMSPGYRSHMEALEKLKHDHGDSLFPFLAVDPRRRGIMKLIQEKVDVKRGPFHGVKLYPPLGYLPSHPNLSEIYEYCAQKDIPITVHCSKGGVTNFCSRNYILSTSADPYEKDFAKDGESKSEFYADPENWKVVLSTWKTLRINFAHFGGSVQFAHGDRKWMDSLIGLLKDDQYPNLFTDLSYYVKPGLMSPVLKIAKDAQIESKVMFGTDYIMMMLEKEIDGLKAYYNNFIPFDRAFHYDNAARFLRRAS